jgi:predicted dehydrogenase
VYPKVDDEATILLTYKKSQVIIQASWNWPYGRKEMELYGNKGYIFCKTGNKMIMKEDGKKEETMNELSPLPSGRNDPFAYFANVIRGNIKMKPFDLSSPENNEIVVKILEAAKIAARTGKTINWDQHYKSSKK